MANEWLSALAPVPRMAVIVLAFLSVATLIVAGLRRWLNPATNTELAARVGSWWVMAAVFFAALFGHLYLALGLFAFGSFWALKEYATLLTTRPADHRALFWSFLAIPVQYFWIAIGWYGMFLLFIPLYMFLFLPFRLVLAGETAGFVRSAAQLQWGLLAFVFGLSHLGMLMVIPVPEAPGIDGRSLLLFLVFTVEVSDVLQYCWGKIAGRHPILPRISPKKTWEGFIGGILSAAGLSLAVKFLTPFSIPETLGIALTITLAGFAGGAVMSAVKRDFGVKDFGHLLPGHGGILDRLDSLCYAAPVFFHWVRYFHGAE